jgi:hypothetical protein
MFYLQAIEKSDGKMTDSFDNRTGKFQIMSLMAMRPHPGAGGMPM